MESKETRKRVVTSKCVLNIPHSGIEIPEHERAYILLDEDALRAELELMTDWYVDELFTWNQRVYSPISRLVCDMERFADDSQESMAKLGMGMVYQKTSDGKVLRRVEDYASCKERIKRKYYDPYHEELTAWVSDILDSEDSCFLVDCHSFDYKTPFITSEQEPVVCIGSDEYHTPAYFTDWLCKEFTDLGYQVRINQPFSGSLVPMLYYGKDERVKSCMIELDRRLYLNGIEKDSEKFPKLQRDLIGVLDRMSRLRF